MQHYFQIPASLMFETIVSLGVGFFTLSMARGFVRRPGAWALAAVAVAFGIHRLADMVTQALAPDLVFASSGVQVLGLMLPFSGTIAVFVLTPLVLPKLLPNVPWELRQQAVLDDTKR